MALARYFTGFLSRANSQTDPGASFAISRAIKNEAASDICSPELCFRASGGVFEEIKIVAKSLAEPCESRCHYEVDRPTRIKIYQEMHDE